MSHGIRGARPEVLEHEVCLLQSAAVWLCVRSVLYPAMVNVLCSKYVRVCAHRGADMLRATAEVVPTTYVKSLKMTGFFVKRQVAKP
jgi:hypothetical protein